MAVSRSDSLEIVGLSRVFGAGTRTRTEDLLITNQLLYQLSYAGTDGGLATSFGQTGYSSRRWYALTNSTSAPRGKGTRTT